MLLFVIIIIIILLLFSAHSTIDVLHYTVHTHPFMYSMSRFEAIYYK